MSNENNKVAETTGDDSVRVGFEAEMRKIGIKEILLERFKGDGGYHHPSINDRWLGWKAGFSAGVTDRAAALSTLGSIATNEKPAREMPSGAAFNRPVEAFGHVNREVARGLRAALAPDPMDFTNRGE